MSKRRSFFEYDSFHNAQLPDEIRVVITYKLQTLSGVAKGLTRTQDSLLILDELSEDRAEADLDYPGGQVRTHAIKLDSVRVACSEVVGSKTTKTTKEF